MSWGGRRAQALVALTLSTYGTLCHLCLDERAGPATTADHLVPRGRGGDDSIENLRPAHLLCNTRRGDRTIEWFRQRYAPHLLSTRVLVDHRRFFSPDPSGHPAQLLPVFFGPNKSGPREIDPKTLEFFTDRNQS